MTDRTTVVAGAVLQAVATVALALAGIRHLYAACGAALLVGIGVAVAHDPEQEFLENALGATWGGLLIAALVTIAYATLVSWGVPYAADLVFIVFGSAYLDLVVAAFPAYFAALIGGGLVFNRDRIVDGVLPGRSADADASG